MNKGGWEGRWPGVCRANRGRGRRPDCAPCDCAAATPHSVVILTVAAGPRPPSATLAHAWVASAARAASAASLAAGTSPPSPAPS